MSELHRTTCFFIKHCLFGFVFVSYFISDRNTKHIADFLRMFVTYYSVSKIVSRIKLFRPCLIAGRIIIDFDAKLKARKYSFGWHNLISSIQNRNCLGTVLRTVSMTCSPVHWFQLQVFVWRFEIHLRKLLSDYRISKFYRMTTFFWQQNLSRVKTRFRISNRGWMDCQNVNQLLIITL